MTDNYGIAQARRYYMHVSEGGTLTANDVGRMVEAMERLEAENAQLKQMWWDAGDVTDLAGTIAELEAKLGEHELLWQAYDGDLFQAYVDANEARLDAEAKLRKSALQELAALGQASEAYQAQLAAEAKLAKAVEALLTIVNNGGAGSYHLARNTLAELKGGKDEWKCPINYTGCTKNCGSYGCGN